jgi:hypothetical protein
MQFDRTKLRAVILHTCLACPPDRLGAVKLHKVLYYLDMIHYAQAGSSVTGSRYRKRPFGPTSDSLLPMLNELQREGVIRIQDANYYGLTKKEYEALVPEPVGVLSGDETALLDDVIDFVCHQNSARTISDYSHALPWEMAEFGGEIPYRSAYLLIPSDISLEALEATKQGMTESALGKPETAQMVFADFAAFRRRLRQAAGST